MDSVKLEKFKGIKATSHLTIFMRGMRAKGEIQSSNYQDVKSRPSSAGKASSVPLIATAHPQRIVEWLFLTSRFSNVGCVKKAKFKGIITQTCNAGRLFRVKCKMPLIAPTHVQRIAE